MVRACVSVVLLAAAGVPMSGCTTNPATGRTILSLMSLEHEIALGAEAAPQFTQQFGGEVPSPELASFVREMGHRMAAETEAEFPGLPWEFTMLNSPVVNAFALPGGKVFFSRGLAEKLTNEAQMAGVIGHEIGHVTAQHGNERISQQIGFNAVLAGLAIGAGVADEKSALRKYGQWGIPALALGGNIVLLKYGRDQELEADRLGMRYMSRVGYDPAGQMEVMQLLAELSQGPRPPEILSTHPDPGARIEQAQNLLATEYAGTQGNPQYQKFPERYEQRVLAVLRQLPPAPEPQQQGSRGGGGTFALDQPWTWCGTCAADRKAGAAHASGHAPETGPVPPREGVYAFFAPAAAE